MQIVPHNGKTFGDFSTQWKNIVHGMESRAVARTHNAKGERS